MWWFVGAWLVTLVLVHLALMRWLSQRHIEIRLGDGAEEREEAHPLEERRSWLGARLALAGFRGPRASAVFLLTMIVSITFGALVTIAIMRSDPFSAGRTWLTESPGGAGLIIEPVLAVLPGVFGLFIAIFPILFVRARRRERVRQVEEDLPITLELLAAQARAGLGLEAGLTLVMRGGNPKRPLAQELTQFQNETIAGIAHSRALRRLAERLDVTSVNVFVTALVHAEQVGGGLSSTLRNQADELRSRRRERALAVAQQLPAKVVVPLVICFLPGIFVWTLGPAIHQFIDLVGQVLRTTVQR